MHDSPQSICAVVQECNAAVASLEQDRGVLEGQVVQVCGQIGYRLASRAYACLLCTKISQFDKICAAIAPMQAQERCVAIKATYDQAVKDVAESNRRAVHWQNRCKEAISASQTLADDLNEAQLSVEAGQTRIEALEAEKASLLRELQMKCEHMTRLTEQVRIHSWACCLFQCMKAGEEFASGFHIC
jgi:23S rRNA G2445 N2-methylase RlmL